MYKILFSILALLACNTISSAQSYLAKNINVMSDCLIESQHSYDSSDQYINMGDQGSWLEWDNVAAQGDRYLVFTFTNGSQSDRSCLVQVNGITVDSLIFPSTTSWQAKGKQVAYKINLPKKVNSIRLKAETASGGPNIYQLEVVEDYYTGPWSKVTQILSAIVPPTFPNRDYNITDYGASGDATTDCYYAFKTAIDTCHKAGGGRVIVPEGTFLVEGPIHLKSNVNLHLASKNSTIMLATKVFMRLGLMARY